MRGICTSVPVRQNDALKGAVPCERKPKAAAVAGLGYTGFSGSAVLFYTPPGRQRDASSRCIRGCAVRQPCQIYQCFAPELTLRNWQYTLDRQTDTALMEEALHWLYSAHLRCPLPSDGSLNNSVAATYTLFVFADGCDTEPILLSGDGYAVVGNMRYRVSQKDMAGLVLLFDHLRLSEE